MKLLSMLEQGVIQDTSVADPTKEASHPYYNEGRYGIIRMLRDYA
jgi:hypothetical protein